jgi:hypothetical protein
MAAYAWEHFYEAAVLETDFRKMPGRVLDAREAIEHRLKTLSRETDGKELTAMDNALAGLVVLEIHLSPIKPLKAASRKSSSKN